MLDKALQRPCSEEVAVGLVQGWGTLLLESAPLQVWEKTCQCKDWLWKSRKKACV